MSGQYNLIVTTLQLRLPPVCTTGSIPARSPALKIGKFQKLISWDQYWKFQRLSWCTQFSTNWRLLQIPPLINFDWITQVFPSIDVFVQFVQFVQFVKIYLIGATPYYIFFRTFLLQLDNEILGKALLKLKLQKLCLCYVTITVTFPFGEERLKLPFIFLHWLDVFVLPISCRQHCCLSIYLYCICTV